MFSTCYLCPIFGTGVCKSCQNKELTVIHPRGEIFPCWWVDGKAHRYYQANGH